MARPNRIGVIDIGFTKIAGLAAEEESPGKIKVIGFGQVFPEGFKNGIVVNLERALSTLRSLLEKIEINDIRFKKLLVYVGINGNYIRYIKSEANIKRKKPQEQVSEKEIRQVKREAQSVRLPPEEKPLHLVPLSYTLDDTQGIQTPLDFTNCHKLAIKALLVHCRSMVLANLNQLLDRLEIRRRRFVYQPLALPLTITEPEEKENGIGIIDIGGWTTVGIYKDGELQHAGLLEIGSEEITNDLIYGLRVKKDTAIAVKEKYGATKSYVADKDEVIPLPETASEEKGILRRIIAEITEIRLEEILLKGRNEIDTQGYSHALLSGVVLTGGTAKIPGVAALATHILGMPVRVATPDGVAENFKDPQLATLLGLAKFGLSGLYKKYALIEDDDLFSRFRRFFKKIFRLGEEE